MTPEEMDAEIAHMDAHLKRLRAEVIATTIERVRQAKDPVMRDFFQRDLEEVLAIGNGRYD
jgi:hypothetical protein